MSSTYARLENWVYTGQFLIGDVYDHPVFKDGSRVRTSVVVDINDETAITKNTIYTLGHKYFGDKYIDVYSIPNEDI